MKVSISIKDAKRILEFCKTNKLDEFFFAKDQGAYFGATVGSHEDETFKNCIVYVAGCDPDKDTDWYDTAHAMFGGDDFGQMLPISWIEETVRAEAIKPVKKFTINLTTRTVSLVV